MKLNHYTYVIVENVPDVCEGIERRMKAFPNWKHIGSFGEVKEAKKNITKWHPHLIFIDWSLIGGSAFEILEEIQNLPDYNPYVISNTAYQSDNPEIPQELINTYRVDKYVVKPIWENLRIHLAEYLTEAIEKANEPFITYKHWVHSSKGKKFLIDVDQIKCICQNNTDPRNRLFFLKNAKDPIVAKITWHECYHLLDQYNIDYFIAKKRHHIIIRNYIVQYERPWVKISDVPFKLDVTKENCTQFENWLWKSAIL